MSGNGLGKKGLVVAVILLFLGMSVLPLACSLSMEKHVLTDNEIIGTYAESSIEYDGDLEYWALLIGVGIYAEHPEQNIWSHLSAEAIYYSLLSSEHWQEDHIKIITCENATKNNIIKGFHWLDSMEDEDDVSVIYFATHGGQLTLFGIPLDFPPFDEKDHCDEILVTYYGFKNPFLTNLRDDELKFLVDRLESQGICVIVDSCYSGGFNDTSRKTSFRSNILAPRYNNGDFSPATFIKGFSEEIRKDGRVILMASQEDGLAFAQPGEGHCFTSVLIKSIGEGFGDFNNNGLISAEEAFNYTRGRLGSAGRSQHPTIYDNYHGELHLTVSKYQIDFNDDCESDIGWTTIDHTGGIGGDLWRLSEIDCTSPTHCWYLGDEDTERYNNNMNNSLVSPEIKLGLNPLLTFIKNVSREQYDFLYLDISTDNWSSYYTEEVTGYRWYWSPLDISLEGFSGKTIQMRFRVESDESIPFNPDEGMGLFMLEDIQIYSERRGR